MPSLAVVRAAYRPSDAELLDRNGVVLHELRVDRSRRRLQWCPLEHVSPALRAAVIASEDRGFYRHAGVDWWALAAAGLRAVSGGPPRGASTITMQLASELDPALRRVGGPRSAVRKWRQLRLARAIERYWTKGEILEAYLNLVSFRGELQGVTAAARVLFGKLPHGLSDAEAVVLAVLLRAPNAGSGAIMRRAQWLRMGPAAGIAASPAALRDAMRRALDGAPGDGLRLTRAAHVARKLLDARAAGRAVRSTLDAAVQGVAEEALQQHLLALRERHVTDGAVLVVHNATGDVVAYVGSSRELSAAREVDGVQARRQAGSTLKPFLYGLAVEERLLTPASLLADTPLEIAVATGLYRPENYDEQFRGLVTARTALSASLNVPAVRTLGVVGADAFVQHLRQLGFVGLRQPAEYYGPALALGAADVSLWELVNAYRTLANGGIVSPLRLVAQAAGDVVNARVYDGATAFLIADILADRESRSLTFGLDSVLATRAWAAVKTGTSKDMRDNWCVGFSRRYTVGVWLGNYGGEPMHGVSGVSGAAPIWRDVMQWLHRDWPSEPPLPPPGVVAGVVTGQRPEWFRRGTEPRAGAPSVVGTVPRIVSPVSGTTIAMDPDIPALQQRVGFEASDAPGGALWLLDGARHGRASEVVLWAPAAGRHELALLDERGGVLDRVVFVVRGRSVAQSR